MSRDGFLRADMDVRFMYDRKIIALSRLLNDDGLTAIAVVMYQSLVLASWEAGERVTLEDSQPAWLRVSAGGVRQSLETVGLIDAEGRVPRKAWLSWYGPALERLEKRRSAGALGGLRAKGERSLSDATALLQQRYSDAIAKPQQSHSNATPTPHHSIPVVPKPSTTRSAHAPEAKGPLLTKVELDAWRSFGPEWSAFKAAWLDRGLKLPPSGDPDTEGSQRATLFPIIDAWPKEVAGWVRSAPKGASGRDVVGHVIRCYRKAIDGAGEEPPGSIADPPRAKAAEAIGSIMERIGGR